MLLDTLSLADARRRFVHCVLGSRQASVADAIRVLGTVQEDSIDVCGRMHDLILRNRVANYRPSMLEEALYGSGAHLFEDYHPNLCALDRSNLRWFARGLRARRASSPLETTADGSRILERIRESGPLRARDFVDDNRRCVSAWGTQSSVASRHLEQLWRQGRLAIADRKHFHRSYDLPERVYGTESAWLDDSHPLPPDDENAFRLAQLHLLSRPLVRPRKSTHPWLRDLGYAPLGIDGDPRPWWASPAFRNLDPKQIRIHDALQLIAPLDPLIYDRNLTRLLFHFDYVWEVYTPVARRVRGYYAMPLLSGENIVGWVDLRFDRKHNQLLVPGAALAPSVEIQQLGDCLSAFGREYDATLTGPIEPSRLVHP